MEIRVVNSLEGMKALAPQWVELHSKSETSHPFTSYQWTIHWWNTFSRSCAARRDELFIVTFSEQDALVGIMPMFVSVYVPWLLRGVRYLRPIGSDYNLTELKGLLCLPNYEEKIIPQFEKFLDGHGRAWDFCRWPDVKSRRERILTNRVTDQDQVENFVIPLPKTWEEFRGQLKRNVREAIRKCINKPKADGLEFTYERVSEPKAIAALLPDFYRLHSLRGAMDKGPTHPDYFMVESHRALIESMLAAESEEFAGSLYVLRLQDECVAMRIGYETNRKLCVYYSGFDPKYGAYSVMTRLLVETMQDAISRGITALNLSTGRDLSKTRWSPVEYTYHRPMVINRRWLCVSKLFQAMKARFSNSHSLVRSTQRTPAL